MTQFMDIQRAQEQESARLCGLLEKHLATRGEMEARFDQADQECIQLASAATAERMAQSPKALESEALLRKRKYERDDIRAAWHKVRSDLERDIEVINGPEVRAFHESALKRMQEIAKLASVRREDVLFSRESGAKRILISHNYKVLAQGKQQILDGIHEIRRMLHCPLAEIRSRITELEHSFSAIDTESREVSELPVSRADELKPETPGNLTTAYPAGADGLIVKVGVDTREHLETMASQGR